MNYKSERALLNLIKYSLPIVTIFISFFITYSLYLQNKSDYEEEKSKLKYEFIKQNKKIVYDEVQRVYSYIAFVKKNTKVELKRLIKNRVYEAHRLATSIYEKYKNQKSKKEIFQIIKDTLGAITFNEEKAYYFITDINGKTLLKPFHKQWQNKNLLNYKDVNGYNFVKKIVKTIKNKSETFNTYYLHKKNHNKPSEKITYYKYFAPYNVVIGTGIYFDDFEKEVKKKILSYINKIRYFNIGYVFVLDYDYNVLSYINKDFIGKNLLDIIKTPNPKNDLENMKIIAKSKEGYYSYIQSNKPETNNAVKKISFIKGEKDWNWIIGSGFYEDDLYEKLEKKQNQLNSQFFKSIKHVAILSSLLTILLLFISYYVSKLIEQKFIKYKNELEQQQNILAQQSKMASMGEMIANIAHQWRQPLSVISTAATGISLQKEMGILTDEEFFKSTAKINESSQYLSKTIDDFKNFFSPHKNKELINIEDTLNQTIKLLDAQLKSKSINIVKEIQNVEFFTLKNELLQVLINILNNARDELIKLNMQRYIFIKTKIKDENLLIEIYDNAGGIKQDNLTKVFEPYFTTKEKSIGTGIGLYMSHQIVHKHLKGNLFVKNYNFTYENNKYKGAMFILEIPILKE
ncbi:cache domain-containing protein [Arcobacter sp. CECT 8985]|uniref:sensor histidine kinase n=1 Tax=Arcobacter sp. CECT 8985 TaxID=1935424 RepID=UPI00100BC4F8|nr:cache domain-containing protein [Arcobacter sp. CECT 8985]RXJ85256.1 histidine kinase [Arcobacter sp. CECT 8985]